MSRIAIVARRLGQGGTDRVAVLLANGFAAAGHAVDLVLFSPAGSNPSSLAAMVEARVRTVVVGRGHAGRTREILSGLPGLVRHLNRTRPDVLLSSGNNVNPATALAHRMAIGGTRLCLKITNPLLRPHDGPIRRRYRRLLQGRVFSRASAVLAMSGADARDIAKIVPAAGPKLRAVSNPYVTLAPLPAPRGPRGDAPRLLAAGRMVAQKNYALLLRAMAEPSARDWTLTILGDGPDRAMLAALAEELGVAGRVNMPGYQGDIARAMRDADMFVLCSRYEGLPAVVAEALAAGLPVVATDCFASAQDLLGRLPGCAVVPPNDPAALAAGIARALAGECNSSVLRATAAPYAVDVGVADHLAALGLEKAA